MKGILFIAAAICFNVWLMFIRFKSERLPPEGDLICRAWEPVTDKKTSDESDTESSIRIEYTGTNNDGTQNTDRR
jgi:hypothetical protein